MDFQRQQHKCNVAQIELPVDLLNKSLLYYENMQALKLKTPVSKSASIFKSA